MASRASVFLFFFEKSDDVSKGHSYGGVRTASRDIQVLRASNIMPTKTEPPSSRLNMLRFLTESFTDAGNGVGRGTGRLLVIPQ